MADSAPSDSMLAYAWPSAERVMLRVCADPDCRERAWAPLHLHEPDANEADRG